MSENYRYAAKGVRISPANPSSQDAVEIVYDGLLPRSGATEVYAHVGFDSDWKATDDYRMKKTSDGFETSVSLPQYADTLNVCFKDAANNWDNNSGSNYTFEIEAKKESYWDTTSGLDYFTTEAGQDLTELFSEDYSE